MFWAGVENPNEPDFLKRNSCTDLPFWVDDGEAPPPQYEEAITPEILAALAYQHMELPGTEVTLAPAQTTKVNLPTWAWLDKADFHEVQATAAINAPGFALTATTTAKPVSLRLEPGTADAVTYPASGECTINDDGSIGEPYARGNADRTPPCGVKYLRSSGDGTFDLQATITWEIAWTGTGGAGGDLPTAPSRTDRPSRCRKSSRSTDDNPTEQAAMSFLKFFSDDVKEMAKALENSGGRMKEASQEMKRADSSQVGHSELQSACDDFADSWDYGFGQLSKLTKGVSKFADKASEEFLKMDQTLYDELKKSATKPKK